MQRSLLFLLFLAFAPSLWGQRISYNRYTPMVAEGRAWGYIAGDPDSFNTAGYELTMYAYYFEGDSTYRGVSYKKMYLQLFDPVYDDSLFIRIGYDYDGPPQLRALFREDTVARQVYAVDFWRDTALCRNCPPPDQEFLYLDFSVQPGDSIVRYFSNAHITAVVERVDTMKALYQFLPSYLRPLYPSGGYFDYYIPEYLYRYDTMYRRGYFKASHAIGYEFEKSFQDWDLFNFDSTTDITYKANYFCVSDSGTQCFIEKSDLLSAITPTLSQTLEFFFDGHTIILRQQHRLRSVAVSLYDLQGRKLAVWRVPPVSRYDITPPPTLAPGIYVVRVDIPGERPQFLKIRR